MPEFPSNSKNSPQAKPPEKVIESVVTGQVSSRKKSLGRRLQEIFIGGDSKSVMNYVIVDVLIPQAKDMLTEAVSSGVERLIYGDRQPPRRPGSRTSVTPGHTNYTRYADRGNNPIGRYNREGERQPTASLKTRTIDDIVLATRVEADAVIERMYDILEDYASVSVADLHSLVDWSSSYTDQKWGWTELSGAGVRRVRDGYALILPKTIALD
jgi:hypothetical protein